MRRFQPQEQIASGALFGTPASLGGRLAVPRRFAVEGKAGLDRGPVTFEEGFFFNPSLKSGLELLELSNSKAPAQLSVFSAKRRDFALQRLNQICNFGRQPHPTFESQNARSVAQIPPHIEIFPPNMVFRTQPQLGCYEYQASLNVIYAPLGVIPRKSGHDSGKFETGNEA